jgi:hypothetical protein
MGCLEGRCNDCWDKSHEAAKRDPLVERDVELREVRYSMMGEEETSPNPSLTNCPA